jgi:hypothetical protein
MWRHIRVVQASQIGALLSVGHGEVDGGEERVTDYVTTREVTLIKCSVKCYCYMNINYIIIVVLIFTTTTTTTTTTNNNNKN